MVDRRPPEASSEQPQRSAQTALAVQAAPLARQLHAMASCLRLGKGMSLDLQAVAQSLLLFWGTPANIPLQARGLTLIYMQGTELPTRLLTAVSSSREKAAKVLKALASCSSPSSW